MPLGIRLASGTPVQARPAAAPGSSAVYDAAGREKILGVFGKNIALAGGLDPGGDHVGNTLGLVRPRVRGRRSVVSRRRATVASLWATIAEESLDATVGVLGGSGSAALGTRFVTQGYRFFTNPSATSLLKILGSDEEEQIRTLTDLLRNSSEEEINDLMNRLTQAISRLAEERQSSSLRRPRPRSVSPSVQRRRARRQRGA